MQKITPFLWFDHQAQEAANFYVELFDKQFGNSKIMQTTKYDAAGAKASGMPEDSVMTVAFTLSGQEFVAINGGPFFKMSGAISFVINCQSQEEVDYFWEKLSADGGEAGQCGWINHDKFGVTWQVTPIVLMEYMGDKDKAKSKRVMEAMLKMNKIEIEKIKQAYNGK